MSCVRGVGGGGNESKGLTFTRQLLSDNQLLLPASEISKLLTQLQVELFSCRTEANALDAAAQGASNAVFLVMNIIANLIAFLAFVEFLNSVISWFGGLLGADYITFQVNRFSQSINTVNISSTHLDEYDYSVENSTV